MPDEPEPEDTTPSTRGTWVVEPIDEWGFRRAAIEAFQERTDTLVQFWDAYVPESPSSQVDPLGAAFEEFTEWVIDEAMPGHSRQGGRVQVPQAPGAAPRYASVTFPSRRAGSLHSCAGLRSLPERAPRHRCPR